MRNISINYVAVFLVVVAGLRGFAHVKHTQRLDDGLPPPTAPTFDCLNGKNPADLTKKQILAEFSKGKCAPLILVPGLLSTKLVVEITDCARLQQDYPELFSVCGFVRCPEKWEEIGPRQLGVPNSEYALWISDVFSPLSVFTYKETNNYCFAKFVRQNIDFSKPVEDSVLENEAFKIRLWGNTPGTKAFFQCGDGATQNLLPLGSHFQSKETRAFLAMHGMLRSRGYVAGLTYQTLPYNFLRSYRANTLKTAFKEALDRLHTLTNKKVVIMGHSLGNLNILHQLNRLSLEDKTRTVKLWIAAGPPFLGAIKMDKTLLSGDDDFIFLRNLVGLRLRPGLEGLSNVQVSYVLTAKDPFTLYKDERWFEAIAKRAKYEAGKTSYEDSGLPFLPPTTAQCSPQKFTTFARNCTMGLYDTSEAPLVRILNQTYFMNQTHRMHGLWNTSGSTADFLKHNHDPEYLKLTNPGVPMAVLLLRTQPTLKSLHYRHNITSFIARNIYYYPDAQTGHGDGTVPTFSTLVPPLKWAWEFDNKAVQGAQPVKVVDLCSTHNQRDTPYDEVDAQGVTQTTKNEFISLSCECMKSRNPHPCAHAAMVSDAGYLAFLGKSLTTGEVGWSEEHQRRLDGLTEDYLTQVSVDCPTIKF